MENGQSIKNFGTGEVSNYTKIIQNIAANGLMISQMVLENSNKIMVIFTKEIGLMVNLMVMEN